MNTGRKLSKAAIAFLLCATGLAATAVAQGSRTAMHPMAASMNEDDWNRENHSACCLQANTGEKGWTLVSAPAGVPTPSPAVVINPPNPVWATALPGSAWIGPTAGSGVNDLPGGLYEYDYQFCLCREVKGQHPVLSLSFFSDNGTRAVMVNSSPNLLSSLPADNNSFLSPPGPFPVVYTGPFLPCPQVNTLKVIVDNQEGSAQTGTPTGFDAVLNVSGATAALYGRCECKDKERDNDR